LLTAVIVFIMEQLRGKNESPAPARSTAAEKEAP